MAFLKLVTQARRRFSEMFHHMREIKCDMRCLFDVSVKAVQPGRLLRNAMKLEENTLKVCDRQYQLNKNCYLIGFGKAVLGMAYEAERILGSNLRYGIISVPEGIQEAMKNVTNIQYKQESVLEVLEGAKNNLPDKNAQEAAGRIKQLVQNLDHSDLLIVLISGGGSSLLPLPLPSVTLEEKCHVIKLLAAKGANIFELNCVRKKLSLLKGGRLAQLAYPAQVVSLILSDIVGDPIDLIASGPTVVNNDAPYAALNVIEKYCLLPEVPISVQMCLSAGSNNVTNLNEIVDDVKVFPHVQNMLIGSNLTAVSASAEAASNSNYNTIILSTGIQGLVTDVGRTYAALATTICKTLCNKSSQYELHKVLQSLRQLGVVNENAEKELTFAIQNMRTKRGICLIAGGETTVVVKGNGLGGRNQELAMIFAKHMNENSKSFSFLKQFHVMFLSAGTDGIDGPTRAAGAFGYEYQYNIAMEQNLKTDEYENNNDSYNFYSKLSGGEDLIVVGHTGTNVMDVHILIVVPIIS